MTKRFVFILSALLCAAVTLGLTACGSDEPVDYTSTQDYIVFGEFTAQSGNFINGDPILGDETSAEYRFYRAIYDRVVSTITAQTWTVSFKQSEKAQKLAEQNVLAADRYSAMTQALIAIKRELAATDPDAYRCHFDMKIHVKAAGAEVINEGDITLSFEGNEN